MPVVSLALDAETISVLAGVILLAICPFCRTRDAILTMQTLVGVAFATHFWLLGLTGAAVISCLGGLQALAALGACRWRVLDRAGYALIPAMVAAALWFWTGPVTLLAALAMALIASGRMCRDVVRLRGLILAGCTVWAVHDALVGAWLMFLGDVLSWLTGAAMLFGPRLISALSGRALPRPA